MNIHALVVTLRRWPPYKSAVSVLKIPFRVLGWLLFELNVVLSKAYLVLEKDRLLRVYDGQAPRASGVHTLCIFAHYDPDGLVDRHVVNYVAKLRSAGCDVVFVSTAKLKRAEIEKLSSLCIKVLVRPNLGYDFGSFRTGFEHAGSIVHGYDRLILANDSVYGPIYPLDDLFEGLAATDFDACGLTESWEHGYHLQSYFLAFNSDILNSPVLRDFFRRVSYVNLSKWQIILKYEIGLTRKLIKAGFSAGALFPYTEVRNATLARYPGYEYNSVIDSSYVNPTHYFWFSLIADFQFPFLKVELLRDNPVQLSGVAENWVNVVSRPGYYDADLILNHLKRLGAARGSL